MAITVVQWITLLVKCACVVIHVFSNGCDAEINTSTLLHAQFMMLISEIYQLFKYMKIFVA